MKKSKRIVKAPGHANESWATLPMDWVEMITAADQGRVRECESELLVALELIRNLAERFELPYRKVPAHLPRQWN